MRLTTDGIVIRESSNIGEADRFVTLLTRDFGVIRAAARGVRQVKNRNAAATQLLCYAQLVLYKNRDTYIIDTARPERMFFELREDIETLALAQYFCELSAVLAPQEEPAQEYLRLLLNALHLLGEKTYGLRQIKAVFELRMLALAGYCPALQSCAVCGAEPPQPVLLPRQGVLCCAACRPEPGARALTPAVLAALRHIVSAPAARCFAFRLPEPQTALLAAVCEEYLMERLGRTFKTLEFFHSL
ncbi:MAG: DNA repair protein RecO [Clostridia bacterium]|nr:DNA repair protein RecO [Clostridia bacterium]